MELPTQERWLAEVFKKVSRRVSRWQQWEKSPALRESERVLKEMRRGRSVEATLERKGEK